MNVVKFSKKQQKMEVLNGLEPVDIIEFQDICPKSHIERLLDSSPEMNCSDFFFFLLCTTD